MIKIKNEMDIRQLLHVVALENLDFGFNCNNLYFLHIDKIYSEIIKIIRKQGYVIEVDKSTFSEVIILSILINKDELIKNKILSNIHNLKIVGKNVYNTPDFILGNEFFKITSCGTDDFLNLKKIDAIMEKNYWLIKN